MKKILLALCALIVVLIAGVVIAVLTVDPNKYKGQIVTMLEKETGRTVRLDGPLKLGFSMQGITLSVNNAALGNPAWASRPQMASIGELDIGVALFPLLDKKLVVTGLKISKADIQLETNRNGQSNTDMQPASAPVAPTKSAAKAQASAPPVAISITRVSVADSRLAMRDKDGNTSVYKVDSLTLGREGAGIAVHFKGSSNNTPVTLDLKTGAADLLADKTWPFDADVVYANYKLTGEGKIDLNKKTASIESFKLSAGGSTLTGTMSATWGGERPSAAGSLLSDEIDLADFKPPAAKGNVAAAPVQAESNTAAPARVFSDAPLNLQSLKSADVHFALKLDKVKAGAATLQKIDGKLAVAGGHLTAEFPGVRFGNSTMSLKAAVDASAVPARLDVSFAAPNVDLTDLLALADMKDFMSGKASANFALTSVGDSPHDLASHANGSLIVISDGGKISTDALQGIYAGLSQLVAAGSGSSTVGLNCLAARFNIKDGVMADNGILADTTASAIKGAGAVNLGGETTDMLMSSKPKLAGKYGALVPPVHIGGTLLKPSYSIKAASVVQNLAGLFVPGGTVTSNVPNVSGPSGQNACVYTLDHPAAAKPAGNAAAPAPATKASDQIKNLLGGKLKGLLGGQ